MLTLLCVALLNAPPEPATGTALIDASLSNWEVATYGGQGVAEIVPPADVEGGSELPVLQLGSGDPLTGLKWTGRVGADDTAKPSPGFTLPRTDYELTWQARRVLGDDFFTSMLVPIGDDVCSLVVGGWGGTVVGLSSLNGRDAAENETTVYYRFEDDVWYDFALTVRDDAVALRINGEQQFRVDPSQFTVTTRVEMEPLKPFGLASFLSSGQLRGLTVRSLGDD